MSLYDPHNPLAIEIRQEMASAYFASCRKMVDALGALRAFDESVASSTSNPSQVDRRSQLLEAAAERVYFVLIQREAMKLAWYDHFFEDYGVPAEIRTRLAMCRRR